MFKFKEDQVYTCTMSDRPWWTKGKDYTIVLDCYGKAVMKDNDGDSWTSLDLETSNNEFKLKENIKEPVQNKTIDLNKLSLEELDEYLELATALEEAEYLMNEFIERRIKKCIK